MRDLHLNERELLVQARRRSKSGLNLPIGEGSWIRVGYQSQSTHGSERELKRRVFAGKAAGYDPLTITIATILTCGDNGEAPVMLRTGVAKRSPRDAENQEVGRAIAFARALRSEAVRVA